MPTDADTTLMADVLAAEIDELVAQVFYADELAERIAHRPELAHVDRDDLTAVIEAALEEMGIEAARRVGEGDA